jgi:hypothetical protein
MIEKLSYILEKLVPVEVDYFEYDKNILPSEFDPQNNIWKDLLVDCQDQGTCGSCWAFSTGSCYSDRFNILMGKKIIKKLLSPTDQILCNDIVNIILNNDKKLLDTLQHPFQLNEETVNNACNGNSLICAYYYLKFYGVASQNCIPYDKKNFDFSRLVNTNYGFNILNKNVSAFGQSNYKEFDNIVNIATYDPKQLSPPGCDLYSPYSFRPFDFCYDDSKINQVNIGTPSQRYTCFLIYSIRNAVRDDTMIKFEIFKWGPICSSFLVYEDFYTFDPIKDGVYIHNENFPAIVGGHGIEIVGWGDYKTKNGKSIPFWWVKNSWGKNYGYNGYFRFLRGQNHCQIEYNMLCMLPNLYFDFSNKTQIKQIINDINNLNIFYIHKPLNTLYEVTYKILASFTNANIYFSKQTFYNNYYNYLFFWFEMYIAIGFLLISYPLKSFYQLNDILRMPGIDYDVIDLNYSFKKENYAGLLQLNVFKKKKEKTLNYNYLFILLFVLFFVILVFFLIKKIYSL